MTRAVEQRQPNTQAWRVTVNDSSGWAMLGEYKTLMRREHKMTEGTCLSLTSSHVPSLIAAVVLLSQRRDLFLAPSGEHTDEDPTDLLTKHAEWVYVGGDIEDHVIYWPAIAPPTHPRRGGGTR